MLCIFIQIHTFLEMTKAKEIRNRQNCLTFLIYLFKKILLFYEKEGYIQKNDMNSRINFRYNSHWYKIPVKAQRLYLMVLTRSVKGCSYSKGKLFVSSLQGLTAVTRFASVTVQSNQWSYWNEFDLIKRKFLHKSLSNIMENQQLRLLEIFC